MDISTEENIGDSLNDLFFRLPFSHISYNSNLEYWSADIEGIRNIGEIQTTLHLQHGD